MIEKLLQTNADYACTFLRTIAGIIIFPYGMQKLLGWFDGVGIKRALEQMTVRKIPKIYWLADYHRAVSRKYCANVRFFRENRGWWTLHNLYRSARI
jgi:hypothetical protein